MGAHNNLLKNSNKNEIDMLGVIVRKRADEVKMLSSAFETAIQANTIVK